MTAAKEYARVSTEVRALIERLPVVLDAHAARQAQHPEFWTFTSDLKHFRLDLLRLAAFLGDEEAREALLAEGVAR